MSFFYEPDTITIKRYFYAEYFFETILFEIFVIKNQNYLEWKKQLDKQDQFSLYFVIFIRGFFYIIETFLNYIFYFFKGNFSFLKDSLKNLSLNQTKTKKKFLINDLYNSFSTKILISSTAFFILYLIIFIFILYLVNLDVTGSSLSFSKSKTEKSFFETLFSFKEWTIFKNLVKLTDFIEKHLNIQRTRIPLFTPVICYDEVNDTYIAFIIETYRFSFFEAYHIVVSAEYLEILEEEARSYIYNTKNLKLINGFNKVVADNQAFAYMMNMEITVEELLMKTRIDYEVEEYLGEIIGSQKKYKNHLVKYLTNNYISGKNLIKFIKELIDTDGFFTEIRWNLSEKKRFSCIFNFKFVSKINFLIAIICLMNILHTFIAFLSLGYDYLLKKLTLKNILILYFISSTTLQIFFKILFIYFLW